MKFQKVGIEKYLAIVGKIEESLKELNRPVPLGTPRLICTGLLLCPFLEQGMDMSVTINLFFKKG